MAMTNIVVTNGTAAGDVMLASTDVSAYSTLSFQVAGLVPNLSSIKIEFSNGTVFSRTSAIRTSHATGPLHASAVRENDSLYVIPVVGKFVKITLDEHTTGTVTGLLFGNTVNPL